VAAFVAQIPNFWNLVASRLAKPSATCLERYNWCLLLTQMYLSYASSRSNFFLKASHFDNTSTFRLITEPLPSGRFPASPASDSWNSHCFPTSHWRGHREGVSAKRLPTRYCCLPIRLGACRRCKGCQTRGKLR
jgi:hypothetical protein